MSRPPIDGLDIVEQQWADMLQRGDAIADQGELRGRCPWRFGNIGVRRWHKATQSSKSQGYESHKQ